MRNMRPFRLLLTVALASLAGAALAAPANTAAARKQIASIYARQDQATRAKDVASILSVTTPDFVIRTPKGATYNRKQSEAMLHQEFGMLQSVKSATTRLNSIRLTGNHAVVLATSLFKGTSVPDKSGKTHTIASTEKDRSTWVRSGDTWKLKRSDVLSVKATVDGRKVNMPDNR